MTLDHLTMIDDADPAHGVDEEAGFGCLDTVRGGLPLRRLTVTQTFVNVHAEPLTAIKLSGFAAIIGDFTPFGSHR